MSFGEHLYRVLKFEDEGMSKRRIKALLQSTPSDEPEASMFDVACSDAILWMIHCDKWDADYLLECLNERYHRGSVLDAVDQVTIHLEAATDNPLAFALEQSFPIRQTMLTIALVKNLSPARDVRAVVRAFNIPPDDRAEISFPENLLRVFDLEELAGARKENISVLMDPLAWDLDNLDNVDIPRVSNFDKACSEATEWLSRFTANSEYDLRKHLVQRYSVDLIVEAATSLEQNGNVRGNPLLLALKLPYPIRLTLVLLALHRWYGTGGESVDVSSDLPPKPPAPGHWGGRTPGFEQPIPRSPEDLDVGPKR